MATTDPAAAIPQRLLDVNETAQVLRVSRAKLYELLAAGDLESVKLGARRLIPLEAVDAFIDNLRTGGDS